MNDKNTMSEAQTVPNESLVKPVSPKQNPLLLILTVLVVILLGSTIFLAYQNMKLQKKIATATQVAPSPMSSYNSNLTAGWKTFSNSEFGFSFRYPNDWIGQPLPTPSSSGGLLLIYSPDGARDPNLGTLGKGTEISVDNPTPVESVEAALTPPASSVIDNSFLPTNLAKNAQGFQRSIYGQTGAIITNGKFIYTINCFVGKPASISCNQILAQILSTFQFTTPTSQTDTSNWKTYNSQLGNYTLKYPSDWYQNEYKAGEFVPRLELSPMQYKYPQSGQMIIIFAYDNPNNLSIDQFEKNQSGISPNWQVQNIGGLQGERSQSLPGQFENDAVFVSKGNKIYELILLKAPGTQIQIDTFNQILSTFQFTK